MGAKWEGAGGPVQANLNFKSKFRSIFRLLNISWSSFKQSLVSHRLQMYPSRSYWIGHMIYSRSMSKFKVYNHLVENGKIWSLKQWLLTFLLCKNRFLKPSLIIGQSTNINRICSIFNLLTIAKHNNFNWECFDILKTCYSPMGNVHILSTYLF